MSKKKRNQGEKTMQCNSQQSMLRGRVATADEGGRVDEVERNKGGSGRSWFGGGGKSEVESAGGFQFRLQSAGDVVGRNAVC